MLVKLSSVRASLEVIAHHLARTILTSLRAKLEVVYQPHFPGLDGKLLNEEQICLLRGLGFSLAEIAWDIQNELV